MARPNDYSRTRYVMMQLSMWVILAGTVAVAAVATRVKRNSPVIELGEPRLLQTVTVRLPNGWRVVRVPDGYIAIERVGSTGPRQIHVIERPDDSALQWFINGLVGPAPRALRDAIPMGVTMGELTEQRAITQTPEGDVVQVQFQAIGTLPSGNKIEVTLTSATFEGEEDPADPDIVKLVAASISEPKEPRPPQLRR